MEISTEEFVFRAIQILQGTKYLYKEVIYGCIQALHENYGLTCKTNDDDLYKLILKTLWNT